MKKTMIVTLVALFFCVLLSVAGKVYSNCATWAGHNDGVCQKVVSGTSTYYQCVPAVCNASGPACTRQM